MSDPKQRVGGRLAAEFLLIVVGVLAAFQVEEYRESRELAERGRAQLVALRTDFAENDRRLRDAMTAQQRVLDSNAALLRIIHGEGGRPTGDSLVAMINRTFEFHRLEPVTGAYDALVSAGDLRLIGNDELRSELARFFGELGDGYEDEDLGMNIRVGLIELIGEQTDFLSILRPSWRATVDFPESSRAPDFDALLENRTFASRVAVLGYIEGGVQRYHRRLAEHLASALTLIDEEVDR